MKTIGAQYIIGLTLGILLFPILNGLLKILPPIGWHFMTLMYALILLFQLIFYFLTSKQKFSWTSVNFILNFMIWTAELVIMEKYFGETIFFTAKFNGYHLSVLGGFLWTTNKIILDGIFRQTNRIEIMKSRIDLKLERI